MMLLVNVLALVIGWEMVALFVDWFVVEMQRKLLIHSVANANALFVLSIALHPVVKSVDVFAILDMVESSVIVSFLLLYHHPNLFQSPPNNK